MGLASGSSFNTNSKFEITLLRHGESDGNALGVIQGQSDFPLTARGREQAYILAQRWLEDRKSFDRIIASPLLRARQTAEIIAETLGRPLHFEPLWKERCFGNWEGLRVEDIKTLNPQVDFFHLQEHPGGCGESMLDLFNRAGMALQNLLRCVPGSFLIVTHGAILQMALYTILGINPVSNGSQVRFRFYNTAFAELTFDPVQHQWLVLGLNNHLHSNQLLE